MKNIHRLLSLICPAIVLILSFSAAKAQTTNGKVAFVRGGDIYTTSGGAEINITNNQADNQSPSFSPDGTKIVFTSYRNPSSEVFVMNVDGSNLIRLTNTTTFESSPSFSPDGTKIVFARQSAVNSIYVMNADGTNQISLTSGFNGVDSPRFSPDGSKIVFSGKFSFGYYIVHTMNADGSNLAALPNQPDGGDNTYPSYSPDGTKLLFRSINNSSFFTKIFLSNADGSNMTAIIQVQVNSSPINTPVFSPDGTKILYGEQYSVTPVRLRVNEYTLAGASTRVFVDNATNPAWQPVRPAVPKTKFDFDGDGKADYAVFRPSDGTWYIMQSQNGFFALQFGLSTDLLAPADYDGDGKFDIGVFRPSTGAWYYRRSSDNQIYGVAFGQSGDIPRPADFDADGKADINVFRPSTGIWYRLNSSTGQFVAFQFGQSGDEPQIADLDGDGKSDYTVFRRGSAFAFFWVESSTGTVKLLQIQPGDGFGYVPTLADYNGDGKTDIAYYYNTYSALRTPDCTYVYNTLAGQKIPVSADYDGDGKANSAIFLVNSGTWSYSNPTCTSDLNNFNWGFGTDKPVEAAYNQ